MLYKHRSQRPSFIVAKFDFLIAGYNANATYHLYYSATPENNSKSEATDAAD